MIKRIAVFSDVHVPYHGVQAQAVLLAFLGHFHPNIVVLAGDLLDFYSLSHFDREPSRRLQLPDDIQQARDYMKDLDAVLSPLCRKVFLGGNHEDRLRKFLWKQAPELYELESLDIPGLLSLEDRSWEYIPYYEPMATSGAPGLALYNLLITHGTVARKWSGYTARAHFERFNYSGISGHTHRLGTFYHRAYGGQYVWFEAGCLCGLEPPYMASPDWQQGWIAGYIHGESDDDPSPRFDLRTVFCYKGKAAWEGMVIKA